MHSSVVPCFLVSSAVLIGLNGAAAAFADSAGSGAIGSSVSHRSSTAFAAANGTIAFETKRPVVDLDRIFLMRADGTRQTNLTPNIVTAWDPAWSPNGATIVFVGDLDLIVMNADGTGQRKLPTNDEIVFEPAWSPDGKKIAFDTREDVFVINAADGRAAMNLTRSPAHDYDPFWSPDGARLAFVSDRDGNQEIYVMDADGAGQTNISRSSGSDTEPAWSPDGTKIAFTSSQDPRFEADIYVMTVDGGAQANLTPNSGYDTSPAWSPDGTRIAFVTGRNGSRRYPDNSEIYVMNADGSNQRNVTRNPAADTDPAWHSRSFPPAPCVVPSVIGRRLPIARLTIRKARCSIGRIRSARSSRPHGRVLRQSPPAAMRLVRGARVNLVVSG